MHEDFAIFITTHGRPNKQKTLDWFKKSGYSGRYFLVIDDLDETANEYIEKYGNENVLVFDKIKYWEMLDTMNNSRHLAAVLYARQYVEDKAIEMGLKSFLVLDDDINGFVARMPQDGKMKRYKNIRADDFAEAYTRFLFAGGFASINPGTQNMYLGGAEIIENFPRKGSNAFFRNVSVPIKWQSAMNEDIITCIEYNKKGVLMCTALPICCETPKAGTGTAEGGDAPDIRGNVRLRAGVLCRDSRPSTMLFEDEQDKEKWLSIKDCPKLGWWRPVHTKRKVAKRA